MATATFANPWHDEIGRFAPKGTGRSWGTDRDVTSMEIEGGRQHSVTTANGDTITLEDHGNVLAALPDGERVISDLLNGVADAHDLSPGVKPPTIIAKDIDAMLSDQAARYGGTPDDYKSLWIARAWVNLEEGDAIYVNPRKITADRLFRSDKPWQDEMPSVSGVRDPATDEKGEGLGTVRFTAMHEYGHVRLAQGVDDVDTIRKVYADLPVLRERGMTNYGNSDPLEAHAEAWAHWSATGGNPPTTRSGEGFVGWSATLSNYYAEAFGWNEGIEALTDRPLAAAGPPSDELPLIIADSDDGPIYIYADGRVEQPLVASAGQFANPWHDEIGRFAPKGTGVKRLGPATLNERLDFDPVDLEDEEALRGSVDEFADAMTRDLNSLLEGQYTKPAEVVVDQVRSYDDGTIGMGFIIRVDGEKVGTMERQLVPSPNARSEGWRGYAAGLYLDDEVQGQGIGTVLQEGFENWAASQGISAIRGVGNHDPQQQFANPWHDEVGKFAPKGTGKKSAGRVSTAEERKAKRLAKAKAKQVPKPTEQDVIQGQVDALLAREGLVRPGGDRRGNNTARKQRAKKLVEEFGDGETCPCVDCGQRLAGDPATARRLKIDTLTQDKILVGPEGGSYKLDNLIPACGPCNQSRGDREGVGVTGDIDPTWGDPRRYVNQVVRANGEEIAARFQARRKQILNRRGVSLYEHLQGNPDALPEDFDDLNRAVGSYRLDRDGIDGVAVHHELGVDNPVRINIPRRQDTLDRLAAHRFVQQLRGVPTESLRSHHRPVSQIHPRNGSFANPWHDEIGRFAPKGTGRKFDVEAVRQLAATAAQALSVATINGNKATETSTAAVNALIEAGRPIYDAALASLPEEHARWFDVDWVKTQYGPGFDRQAQTAADIAMTEAVTELIRQVRPGFGEGELEAWAIDRDGDSTIYGGSFTAVDEALVEAVQASAQFFPREWVDGMGVGVNQTKGVLTAWYTNGQVHLPTWSGGMIDMGVVTHEVTHALDDYNPNSVMKSGLAFLAQRKTDFGGRFKTHSGVGGNSSTAKAVDDHFHDPYTGAFYGDDIEHSDGSEALSTNMQRFVDGTHFRAPHSSASPAARKALEEENLWFLGTLVSA